MSSTHSNYHLLIQLSKDNNSFKKGKRRHKNGHVLEFKITGYSITIKVKASLKDAAMRSSINNL